MAISLPKKVLVIYQENEINNPTVEILSNTHLFTTRYFDKADMVNQSRFYFLKLMLNIRVKQLV